MVDISLKEPTARFAKAEGTIYLLADTLDAIIENRTKKGDVFAAARIAGILAAKRCDELIPLCHSLPLDGVVIDLRPCPDPPRVEITAEVNYRAQTGAEMEALLAVSVAALTIYDMVKAVDRSAIITNIRLTEKSGGKSGHYIRKEQPCRDK